MYSVYFGQKPRINCEAGRWVGFCLKCTYYIGILFILGSKGGKEGGGGDSISGFIDKQKKCFVLEMLFILWVVIIFVDKCLYNMFRYIRL